MRKSKRVAYYNLFQSHTIVAFVTIGIMVDKRQDPILCSIQDGRTAITGARRHIVVGLLTVMPER